MSEFDHGPPVALARHFDLLPDPPVKEDFWFDWGPIFYRGQLNGSARVLCIASDVARRQAPPEHTPASGCKGFSASSD